MKNFGLLILRLTVGTMMAGHGAQKVFGAFEGPGLQGTKGFMENLGVRPGQVWGPVAAVGEFSGGVLTALGFLHPIGPQNIAATMIVATKRVHWKLPLWASAGGAELPLTNLAAALALMFAGPGRFSLDHLFGFRLPRWLVALSYLNVIGVTAAAIFRPEVVQRALDSVIGEEPAYEGPADSEPHLEVETVHRTQEAVTEQVPTV